MRPTIVTSASVMTPLAGLSCAAAGATTRKSAIAEPRNEATARALAVRWDMDRRSLSCGFRRRFHSGRGGRRRARRRGRGHRLLGGGLRLHVRLFLLGAIEKLFRVIGLAGGE